MSELFNSPVFWGAVITALFNLYISYRTIRRNNEIQSEIERLKGSISIELENHKNILAMQKDRYSKDYESIVKKRDEAAGVILASLFDTYSEIELLRYKIYNNLDSFEKTREKINTGRRAEAVPELEKILEFEESIRDEINNIRIKISSELPASTRKNAMWFDKSRLLLKKCN